jgi:5,5'-dehydrodivanillate O-demethylase
VAMTTAENERFTQVGPGTPMGELMRRHWQPIAAVAELDEHPIKPVRLLGEDLVLYRDLSGTYGLVDKHCPHRRADMAHGYVEDCGIRCSYHGWKFDERGQCIHQPYEDAINPGSTFKDGITTTAYRAEAKAGMVWAYLGPDPAPLIPNWEPFTYEHVFAQIVFHIVDCNWLQCQENSIDPVHFEWLHSNWKPGQSGAMEQYAPTHRQLGFDEWEHGFRYKRILDGGDETADSWVNGRLCLLPNVFVPLHFEWRVPIDDEHTLSVIWQFDRVPAHLEPFEQETIPYWWGKLQSPESGELFSTHVLNQDTTSWVGQGVIADRTKEHIGRSDRGVVMLRRQLEADMQAVEQGRDPKGIIRDPEANGCISWPNNLRDGYIKAPTPEQILQRHAFLKTLMPGSEPDDYFFLMAGQPLEVRAAYLEAMGLA